MSATPVFEVTPEWSEGGFRVAVNPLAWWAPGHFNLTPLEARHFADALYDAATQADELARKRHKMLFDQNTRDESVVVCGICQRPTRHPAPLRTDAQQARILSDLRTYFGQKAQR